ncbi:hypothetical protein B0H10DRAFT_1961528 [Mycena sp. CBHHK59/15]|nr:hypothetical protein B0H10DRAFT_1961528 [Mycena sp. CBHHK59/15]
MGLDEESEDEFEEDFPFTQNVEEQDRFPHGSHTEIIWVMWECKTPNVPSFSALRKKQSLLTGQVDIKTEHHTSSLGNHFYMNHASKLLTLAKVAGPISESWQAWKWTTEVSDDDLSPMWADWTNKNKSHGHFYIKELARQLDGTYVVPIRWVTVDRVVHADVQYVDHTKNFKIDATCTQRIPALTLESNYLDLRTSSSIDFSVSLKRKEFKDDSVQYPMPHPLRTKAQGRPMFCLCVMPWSNNVSGNVSKQYNAHTNMYVTNLNLPHHKLSQEYFVQFTSTSPHTSSSELFTALGEDWFEPLWSISQNSTNSDVLMKKQATRNGGGRAQRNEAIEQWASDKAQLHGDGPWPGVTEGTAAIPVPDAWHGAYNCELEQEILFEIIPYVLPEDNLVGGTKEYLETNMGYTALYNDKISQYWVQRLHKKANSEHHTYLTDSATRDMRLKGTALKDNARKAVKEEIKHWIRLELWAWLLQQPDDNFASLALNDGVDPHRDTPIEILHSYLLGNDKYVWHDTMGRPEAKPICCTIATGELRALLWFPEIKNMDVYLGDIKVLVDNGLDLQGLIDPQRIIVKGKLHTFLKIFSGLAQPFSMQPRYLNVGRTWSASSIWSAVDGGKVKVKSIPRQAGVSDLSWHPTGSFNVAWDGLKSLGWKVVNKLNHSVKLQVFKKRTPAVWDLTSELVEPAPLGSSWNRCKSVIARSGDLCVQLSEIGPAKHTETMAKTQATRVQNRTNNEAMTSAQEKRQHEGNDPESKSNPEEEGDRGK